MSIVEKHYEDTPTSSGGHRIYQNPQHGLIRIARVYKHVYATTTDAQGQVWREEELGLGHNHPLSSHIYSYSVRLTAFLSLALMALGVVAAVVYPGKITGAILPLGVVLWIAVLVATNKVGGEQPGHGAGSAA